MMFWTSSAYGSRFSDQAAVVLTPLVSIAIPALQPIVHDLFVLRGSNKADAGKELETQKEVVVSMLLRLIQHHQVLEMFILVLQQCHKENEDKWKRLSRQIADVILPMIAKQQVSGLTPPLAVCLCNWGACR